MTNLPTHGQQVGLHVVHVKNEILPPFPEHHSFGAICGQLWAANYAHSLQICSLDRNVCTLTCFHILYSYPLVGLGI